jgi:ribosomal protein S18 acetylase RimI-like enzyme
MHTRAIHNRKLRKLVTVRPLRNGDVQTIAALFDRLSDASRASRFHGAKPKLNHREVAFLAEVGPNSHVLVAHVGTDPLPAGLARLARDPSDRHTAEIAFEVADCYQRAGLGSLLVNMLLADARAAGISHVDALVKISNRPALKLLHRALDHATLRIEDGATCLSATL